MKITKFLIYAISISLISLFTLFIITLLIGKYALSQFNRKGVIDSITTNMSYIREASSNNGFESQPRNCFTKANTITNKIVNETCEKELNMKVCNLKDLKTKSLILIDKRVQDIEGVCINILRNI